ncbi:MULTISPECIES: phosphocholine-specific phospholipase C [Niastella]|uniref:phospholipase C n=1 Tax=Niastella soli TaxID=2821487 RepID=A0ABS3YZY4_9BACT|nr:phospholipase C, phosphocholine-specific [Niastella soli]MBO9203475.1 phospholipase C, phosphocholine-specific [Niastella soli]
MDTRREFLKKASVLSGGAGLMQLLPASIAKALAIDPEAGSTWQDAEHIVFLMQENRSFDHAYGSLQGVRGFNDPRAIRLPNKNLVFLQSNKEGDTYAPFRLDIHKTKATWMSSLPHSWANQVDARNNGHYDKWLEAKHSGNKDYRAMPLTMGFHTREDIPFYYSLADAFTVCDHNFCSSLTGTTPNRLYFWSGTIRDKQEENAQACVWNEDADYNTMVSWATFPERLEENGISWKVYQNELSVGVGFAGEEDSWLANFGDNPLEYFTQYNVKFHPAYINSLPKAIETTVAEIKKMETGLQALSTSAVATDIERTRKRLEELKKQLATLIADQKKYTKENFEKLSAREKALHTKAFDTNIKDPNYHQLTDITYKDGDTERQMKAPKGDVLHQFREDVKNGSLPTVSWLVAPENFSDHPSAAWFGIWYISEVLDILTQNPEVWKKTIFVLTYDENDGYYDHLPPFVAPHPHKASTGSTSSGINTGVDYVASNDQQSIKDQARESSIGLGYRVPMVIASPWSRGGWVNSQVFDHTSSIQFLEKFLSHKTGKKIEEPNISQWRRTVCGDLTSVFRPYNGEKITLPEFLERDEFIEGIHKAQFRQLPSNYKKLTAEEIATINKAPWASPLMPQQEKGIRDACALPYELYADSTLSADKKTIEITLRAGNTLFGKQSAGSPFHIYAPGKYQQQELQNWAYAVIAGQGLKAKWQLNDFENNTYHLQVYGPNGFFRQVTGNQQDPQAAIEFDYETDAKRDDLLTGNIYVKFSNEGNQPLTFEITDNAYKAALKSITVPPGQNATRSVIIGTTKTFGWYDFSVSLKGNPVFEKRYAGRVETGKPGKTDPFMGRVV